MKKTLFTALLSLTAFYAGAQTVYDGLTFSKNEYFGTARSIALGNAMTAVGGDLGSISLNPAGSAVAGYSQFTITPGLSISTSTASYSAYPVSGVDIFSNPQSSGLTRFTMPNFGTTVNWKTGRKYGLKSVTYGFVFNANNNYADKMIAGGINDKTSYLSSMAVNAQGFDVDFLNGYRDAAGHEQDVWDYAYWNVDDQGIYPPWNDIVNAQAGAIGVFGDINDPDYYYRYIAATELFEDTGEIDEAGNHIYDIRLGGPLQQTYGRRKTGSKYDALFNVGFNFSDRFYLGANIGVVGMDYSYSEYFKEAAVDPADFPNRFEDKTAYFNNYRSRYSYTADVSGVYAKIGFIAKPSDGLRIGAAIQTPTAMSVDERWKHSVDIHYDGKDEGTATSPEGEWGYEFRAPYRVNAGIAYTFFGMALLSFDYEMTDYSTMKFRDRDGYDDTFTALNSEIRQRMGKSNMFRLGAEIKPIPEIAVRAGYNFTDIPEYDNRTTLHDKINAYSVGLGYSSPGSFFADIAGRLTAFSDENISPYADYLADYASPLILNKRERWDITLTLGWRF